VYRELPGLHDLRCFVFAPGLKDGETPAERTPRLLVLAFLFDGDALDVLEALVERASNELEAMLRHCTDFEPTGDPVEYIARHRVESGYFFRDIGPVNVQAGIRPEAGDATKAEIEQAFGLEERFERFYVDHPIGSDPGGLRAAFLREFGSAGFEFPLTEFERPVIDEARWARRAGELMQRLQERAARGSGGLPRRAAHAKTHALASATFRIDDTIPAAYRVGLFAEPGAEYRAVVRLSNGSEKIFRDRRPDARGLALSVELPRGPGDADLLLEQDAAGPRQDFVLFSHPTFFASDIRRFATLVSIGSCRNHWRKLVPALAFAASSRGLREGAVLASAVWRRVVHPLAAEFHSGTAYLLGPDHVTKYSIEPADPERFARFRIQAEPDYLRRALEESLERGPIDLYFYVHVLGRHASTKNGVALTRAVEDATLDWRRLGAEKVRVAAIRIDRASGSELGAEPESWAFNPWNALAAHRPLGSLNRARLAAYRASAALRGALPAEAGEREARRESGWSWNVSPVRDSVRAAE
jgi:hypothetical protein